VADTVRVTGRVAIPVEELEFRVSRSSGPGGQGVNTTDSRVELRFDLAGSPSLTAEEKERAARRLRGRLSQDGTLRVVAQTQRSQLANRRLAAKQRRAATKRLRQPPRPEE